MDNLTLSKVSDWKDLNPGDFVVVVNSRNGLDSYQGFVKDVFRSYHPDGDFTTFTITNPVLDDSDIGQVRMSWDMTQDNTTVYAYVAD